jgi:DNA-binding response OmpR family regulator
MTASKRKEILVVDNELSYLEMMCRTLRMEGHKALPASSHVAGVNSFILYAGDFDLIISAVALEERNGCELVKRLLSIKPNLQVLFVSAPAGAEVCRFYGMLGPGVHFLEKPFTQDEFTRLVRLILEQQVSSANAS